MKLQSTLLTEIVKCGHSYLSQIGQFNHFPHLPYFHPHFYQVQINSGKNKNETI